MTDLAGASAAALMNGAVDEYAGSQPCSHVQVIERASFDPFQSRCALRRQIDVIADSDRHPEPVLKPGLDR